MSAASDPSIGTKIQHVDQGDSLVVKTGGILNVESGGAFKIAGVDVTATVAAVANNSARYVAAGSTKTLTAANDKQTIKLDTLTGSVATLPAAIGSGVRIKFLVTVLATSNSHKVQVANNTDFIIGSLPSENTSTNAVTSWTAANSGTVATNSDTVTLNRSTTGSVSLGEWFSLEDVAANTWAIDGLITQSGTAATPFTAAV